VSFNRYFQEEVAFLRELGREFSQAHPILAPMLADSGADPDVERLLEGVAFLTGRIRQKLDDEIPEAIHAITALLFPHFLRPLPGASILELTPSLGGSRGKFVVPRGTPFGSRDVQGTTCIFQSSDDCTIAPWEIDDVRLESLPGARQQLRLSLRVDGSAPLDAVAPERTRIHLAGDVRASLDLLMWLHQHTVDVVLIEPRLGRTEEREISLGKGALRLVGFGEDEALLPASETSQPGLRMLAEYFTLPQKFSFVEVEGLGRAAELGELEQFDVAFRFDKPFPYASDVGPDWMKLHCVPIVNVFPTSAEPLRVVPTRERYLVRPAGLAIGQADVYAIGRVETLLRATSARSLVPPYLSFARKNGIFYTTHLMPGVSHDGADLFVAFGTHEDGGVFPEVDVVSMDLLATNREVASALRPGEISVPTPGSPPALAFRNLTAVTPYVPAVVGRELHWRMVAHAAMGLRSLANAEVLRAALDVYDLPALVDRRAARAKELRMAAIKDVRVTPAERLFRGAIVRGVNIEVDVDEAGFLGDGDVFLFSAILDRLYASYVSINAFSKTTVTTTGTKLRFAWPARSGNVALL